MRYLEKSCKSVLVKSKLPDCIYVVNPYTGCEFACGYCYAAFMGRFVNESTTAWGEYVIVKVNAVEVFRKELGRMSPNARTGSILLSSVTDPYQPIERRYRLTRGILSALVEERYPGVVSVLTKSPIILDDVELLHGLPNADIGITITTTDDKLSRLLEVRAPSTKRRLRTLTEINAQNLNAYAFVGPLLPHFCAEPEALEALFSEIRATGTKDIYVELINTSKYIRSRLDQVMALGNDRVAKAYTHADDDGQRRQLSDLVLTLVQRFGFNLRLGHVLDHRLERKQSRETRRS